MGKRKAKQILAYLMSAVIMCSTLLTNSIVARAAEDTGTFRIRLTPMDGCNSISYQIGEEAIVDLEKNQFTENPEDQSGTVWYSWESSDPIAAGTTIKVTVSPAEGYTKDGEATENEDGSYTYQTTVVASESKEIEIRLAKDNKPGSQANPGDVSFRIDNSQNGNVFVSTSRDGGFVQVSDGSVESKDSFAGADKIYVKYELNPDQSLDNYVDSETGISCNVYRVDGVATNLEFDDSNIAEVPYNADKALEIQIRFAGGKPGPVANPGDVSFRIDNSQNGNVFVSTSRDGGFVQVSDGSVESKDSFAGADKIYVKYELNPDQSLDNYVDSETGISCNVYRVEGVATNLEFDDSNIAEVPYDADKALEIQIRFAGGKPGPGSGASKDYPFETEATSNITFEGTQNWDGAGLAITAKYYINGVACQENSYDEEACRDIVTHLTNVTYPYDEQDERTPIVTVDDVEVPAVEIEFVNQINARYTSIVINGIDYSYLIPGTNSATREWDILDAMSLNGNSQDISFIIQVPKADTYNVKADMEIIGETRYTYESNDSKVKFTIDNGLNGTVGYKYDTFDCPDVSVDSATFPTSLEEGKTFTIFATPKETFEFRGISLIVNGECIPWEDVGNPNIDDIFTADGMSFVITESIAKGDELEILVSFSEDEEWKAEQMRYFPTGNFLWSNLEEDRYTDMFLDNTQVKFVRFEYKDREGKTIVIDDIKDMNGESYLSFSENYDKGEATLFAGGKLTVQLVPRYGYQVVEFGPNGGAFGPEEDAIATYTFTIANGNAHLGARCAPVDDAVNAEATGITDGGIALDVEGDENFEIGTAVLEVTDTETSETEEAAFANAAPGYDVDSYLDLSLNNVVYKGSADDVWATEVSELVNPATISLTVDEPITEDVEIIHQKHDGTYEVLPATYDEETNTITFETDSFSKYAIAKKVTDGWAEEENGKVYYENGKKVVGWKQLETKWYYFDASGLMVTGWLKLGTKWYYFDASGVMATSWQKLGTKWYYFNTSGVMLTSWQKLGAKWYYFDASGAMLTGWQKLGTKWYYFNAGGAMLTSWQKLGTKWYYFNAGGAMLTGWQKLGTKWYYFESSGAMVTGWKQIGTKWYYFNAGGVMLTGWQKLGSDWYYFNASGVMLTGWQKIGTKWYYFYYNGKMAHDTYIGRYYLDSNGVMK